MKKTNISINFYICTFHFHYTAIWEQLILFNICHTKGILKCTYYSLLLPTMNIKNCLFLFYSLACCHFSLAQKNELGLFLGGSYYIGDLNPIKQFHKIQPSVGLVYRGNINYRQTIKCGINYGKLTASDAQSNDITQRNRNLNFTSTLWEATAQYEFNFFPYETGNWQIPSSPFVFIGISAFRFNPQADVNGNYVDLRNLSTEGQGTTYYNRKKYSTIQPSIPFGIGFKATVSKHLSIAAEWGMRKTFTDYIDDVSKTYVDPAILEAEKGALAAELSNRSNLAYVTGTDRQRGNSKNKDWYSFAGITVAYKFTDQRDRCPAY